VSRKNKRASSGLVDVLVRRFLQFDSLFAWNLINHFLAESPGGGKAQIQSFTMTNIDQPDTDMLFIQGWLELNLKPFLQGCRKAFKRLVVSYSLLS
jgi:hypothetical protein